MSPLPAHGVPIRQEEGTERFLQRQPYRVDRDPCRLVSSGSGALVKIGLCPFPSARMCPSATFSKGSMKEKTIVVFYENILKAKCSYDPLNYPSQALGHCGPIPWAIDGAASGGSLQGVSACTELR